MSRARRRHLASLTCVLACATAVAPALGAPADRATALAGYAAVLQHERVGAGWSGTTHGCAVGAEAPASLEATRHTVNTLRAFAGVAPVAFDERLNRDALAAALMMRAASRLSHTPGPDWPCYSVAGAGAASRSNLYLGSSGAAAMVGYVEDRGVASLGHRRWLLNPQSTVFGSGSTGSTNALYVVTDAAAEVAPDQAVAWPPAGWVPWQWIFTDWSLALGAPSQLVSFQNPQVTVTIDGVAAAARNVRVLGDGYGPGTTLAWQVPISSALTTSDRTLQIAVSGATIDGRPHPVSWTVAAFRPEPRFTRALRIRRPFGARHPVRAQQRLAVSTAVAGAATTRYRWLRNGRSIAGATRATYRVAARDRGQLVAVRVTASATAIGPTTVRTSPPVRIRRR